MVLASALLASLHHDSHHSHSCGKENIGTCGDNPTDIAARRAGMGGGRVGKRILTVTVNNQLEKKKRLQNMTTRY